MRRGAQKTKRINLALQGGGAHGAFTWGVLDHLLSDERLSVEGISGTSAGAVNAVMLADGLVRGGRAEAQKRLADFWRAASSNGNLPALQRAVMERLLSFMPLEGTPVQAWFDALSRYFSPYDVNPLNINPLKDLIERFVDFEALRACSDLQIFISATNVQTGRVRIFPREKITADAVMASACLPLLFRAVEIDGVPYWDGGYLGNPVIFPFFRTTTTEDVLVVQINPLVRNARRRRRQRDHEPHQRDHLQFLADRRIPRHRFRRPPDRSGPAAARHRARAIPAHQCASHRARAGSAPTSTPSSKLSTDYDFFEMLRVSGKRAARRFLDEHFDDIGVRSTVDLRAEAQAEWA